LREFVEEAGVFSLKAAWFAGIAMSDPEWVNWINSLSSSPEHTRCAVQSSIGHGDVRIVPWLLHIMHDPGLSRTSAEAFSTLTGVDLTRAHLDQSNQKSASAPASDDTDLPEPDVAKVSAWWQQNSGSYTGKVRRFLGDPVSLAGLHQSLIKGNQRQRTWAADLLGCMCPDKPLFPLHAPAFRQRARLGVA